MENTSAQKDLHLFLCASFPLFIQAKLVCVCVCVCVCVSLAHTGRFPSGLLCLF